MSTQSQERINGLATLIEVGRWQMAVDMMKKDGMSYQDIMDFCLSINFYPDDDFCNYAK